MSLTIMVIIEQANGIPAPASYEALSFAKMIQEHIPADIVGVTVGSDAIEAARKTSHDTGCNMVCIETQSSYNGESMRHILEQLTDRYDPAFLVTIGTSQGADYGPGLAVRLQSCCISGVRGIESVEGSLGFIREVQAGKLLALAVPTSKTAVLLVQPGVFSGHKWNPQAPGKVESLEMTLPDRRTRNVEVETKETGKSDLGEADVIVAVGRGIGKPENLELANQLAKMFQRAAVAGSRPVCDSGWLEYRNQVGITGQSVAPKLYIAAGISGASQHISAMAGSGFVVSINNDPQAAIFNVSDVCIVEDLVSFLPLMAQTLEDLQ